MRRVRFESANERSKGEEEEGKGRGRERKRKGKEEREIGSEALAETEKIANAPAGNRTRDPSKRGWCSTIEPPRQATSPASLFEILIRSASTAQHRHYPMPTDKTRFAREPDTVAIVHRARPERIVIKGRNAKREILKRKRKVEGRGRGRERKRKGKKEEGKGGKGNWKWSFGRNGKNRKRPSRESNPGPQQTRLMLYHWAPETHPHLLQLEIPDDAAKVTKNRTVVQRHVLCCRQFSLLFLPAAPTPIYTSLRGQKLSAFC